jgi:hypothetical protein
MSIEEKVRGLCRVLLAAQNDEAVLRMMPRLSEALDELGEKLGKWPMRKTSPHDLVDV